MERRIWVITVCGSIIAVVLIVLCWQFPAMWGLFPDWVKGVFTGGSER